MGWTLFYLIVILKIPVVMLLWIVHWAWNSVPEEETQDGGGGEKAPPVPIRPRGRGPHGEPRPPAPDRIRTPGQREPVSNI